MHKILVLLLLTSLPLLSFGQERAGEISPEDMELLDEKLDTIALLAFAIVNDSTPEYRFAATRKLIPTLVSALQTPNSFNYNFSRAQNISIQYPQDSSFRVFTWQLYVDVDEYRYYGAIQMNTPDLQMYPLIDRSFEVMDIEQQILTPNQWYGAVYYGIKKFESSEGPMYILFGYDGYEFFNRRKLAEVLSFQNGQPVFGAPVFVERNEEGPDVIRNRLLLEYSSEASIKLNYDDVVEGIIFDHLIMYGGSADQSPKYLPDGSYEGYQLVEGKWMHIPKIFDQVLEAPPRPEPILDSRSRDRKDIFGRDRDN